MVVENLKQRDSARPRTEKTLTSTIVTLLAHRESTETAASLIAKLKAAGKLSISNGKVIYEL